MKKGLVVLAVSSLLAVAACGASVEQQQSAKDNAEDRGFTTTAMSTDEANGNIFIEVSFGEKGCVGRINYHSGDSYQKMTLLINIPVPGTTNEATVMKVDDPRVEKLRDLAPLSHLCFNKE